MIATIVVSFALAVGFVVATIRAKKGKSRILRAVIGLAVVTATVLGGLTVAIVSAMRDAEEARIVDDCRAPLEPGYVCGGYDDTWIECNFAFRAEGRPEQALCRQFMALRRGVQGSGEPADYDDVEGFSETECAPWRIPQRFRCFIGTRSEHEATNRYLQAFARDCTEALIFRSCNAPLEAAIDQEIVRKK
ncbi:MAG: hypothetical protein AAF436_07615 [Myxococcota bacterium]